jgi:Rps23 Pro-64 3,4-dihydroxylase Tpa1-like proline 4-hydroxylase
MRGSIARVESSVTVTAQTEFFTVLDDFLPPAQFDRLWNFLQIQPMQRVEALGRRGHWLIEDEDTLRGPTVGWGHAWDAQHPTGSPMDDVMQAIVDRADLLAPAVGRYKVDWAIFSAMVTIYRAGQGLVWHRDSEANTGSYIFYAHPEWSVDWGGELFLAHTLDVPRDYGVFFHKLRATQGLPNPPPGYPHLDNDDANDLLMKAGFGSFVVPKPNRIVIIKGGTPHAIAKVTSAAGGNVRASVGGFFKKLGVPVSGPEVTYPV